MTRGANFHADPGRQFGGKAQTRTENLEDERVTRPDELHTAAHADTERFKAFRILVVGGDAAHDGTSLRRQCIQPYGHKGLLNSCHNVNKIGFPASVSTSARLLIDATGHNLPVFMGLY